MPRVVVVAAGRGAVLRRPHLRCRLPSSVGDGHAVGPVAVTLLLEVPHLESSE